MSLRYEIRSGPVSDPSKSSHDTFTAAMEEFVRVLEADPHARMFTLSGAVAEPVRLVVDVTDMVQPLLPLARLS